MPKTASRSKSRSTRRTTMRSPKILKNVLQSQVLLWLLVVMAGAMMIMYISKNQLTSLAFLLLVGFLSTFFTKNMVISLLVGILGTLLFRQVMGLKEGMEGKGDEKPAKKAAEEEEEEAEEEEVEEADEEFVSGSSKESLKNASAGAAGGKAFKNNARETMEMLKVQERMMDKAEKMAPRIEKLMSMVSNGPVGGLVGGLSK